MSLSLMPAELILTVADNLPTTFLNSLLRTCQSLRALLMPVLTKRITTEHLASTILKRGIEQKHLPTVHLALAHDASWHVPCKGRHGSCYNALHAACDSNHLPIVAALLAHYGAGMTVQSRCYNALETALIVNDIAMATVLLEHGAPLDLHSCRNTALGLAASCGNAAMAELLVKYGAPVESETESLLRAIQSDRWDVVRVFLREGVPVGDWCEWAGRTPLTRRSPEQVEAWIQHGLVCTKAGWEVKLRDAEMKVYRGGENLWVAESGRRVAERQVALYKMFIAGNLTAHWNWY